MSQPPIELKGSSFTLSVIHLYHTQPDVIQQALQDKINQAPDFLKNAPIVLNVAALNDAITDIDWLKLHQAITATGLRIVGVSGLDNAALKHAVMQTGLPVMSEGKAKRLPPSPLPLPLLITKPVRSGQTIYSPNNDLIVVGNISAGAELVADGNIYIYGILRGRALAGASGNHTCQIFCTCLEAELVSIAGKYWLRDEIPSTFMQKSVRLALQENNLIIHELN